VAGTIQYLLGAGKYILISEKELDTATEWLQRWGTPVTFFSRFVPGVRTYISFPAGMSRIPRLKFATYTFLGSLGWCAILAGIGYALGPSWEKIATYLHGLDVIVLLLLVAGVVWYIRRHMKRSKI
jgi:membrane protein DedA with SNARE-associated domain